MRIWEHLQVAPGDVEAAGADGWEAVTCIPFASGPMILCKRPYVEKTAAVAQPKPKRVATRKKKA